MWGVVFGVCFVYVGLTPRFLMEVARGFCFSWCFVVFLFEILFVFLWFLVFILFFLFVFYLLFFYIFYIEDNNIIIIKNKY
jgi:hypothetical protein